MNQHRKITKKQTTPPTQSLRDPLFVTLENEFAIHIENLNISYFENLKALIQFLNSQKRSEIEKLTYQNMPIMVSLTELYFQSKSNPDKQQKIFRIIHLFITEFKFNINVSNQKGWSPLAMAVTFNDIEMVSLLLQNNADTTMVDKEDGRIPLTLSTNLEITKLLLKANPSTINYQCNQNFYYHTALSLSISTNHLDIAEYLLSQGANPNFIPHPNQQLDDLKVFILAASPIVCATQMDDKEDYVNETKAAVALLVKYNVDLNGASLNGKGVLFELCYKTNNLTLLKELMSKYTQISLKQRIFDGSPVIFDMIYYDKKEFIKFFIENDGEMFNNYNLSMLFYAIHEKKMEIFNYIWKILTENPNLKNLRIKLINTPAINQNQHPLYFLSYVEFHKKDKISTILFPFPDEEQNKFHLNDIDTIVLYKFLTVFLEKRQQADNNLKFLNKLLNHLNKEKLMSLLTHNDHYLFELLVLNGKGEFLNVLIENMPIIEEKRFENFMLMAITNRNTSSVNVLKKYVEKYKTLTAQEIFEAARQLEENDRSTSPDNDELNQIESVSKPQDGKEEVPLKDGGEASKILKADHYTETHAVIKTHIKQFTGKLRQERINQIISENEAGRKSEQKPKSTITETGTFTSITGMHEDVTFYYSDDIKEKVVSCDKQTNGFKFDSITTFPQQAPSKGYNGIKFLNNNKSKKYLKNMPKEFLISINGCEIKAEASSELKQKHDKDRILCATVDANLLNQQMEGKTIVPIAYIPNGFHNQNASFVLFNHVKTVKPNNQAKSKNPSKKLSQKKRK